MRIDRILPLSLLAGCLTLASAQTFTLVHVFHGVDGATPGGWLRADVDHVDVAGRRDMAQLTRRVGHGQIVDGWPLRPLRDGLRRGDRVFT